MEIVVMDHPIERTGSVLHHVGHILKFAFLIMFKKFVRIRFLSVLMEILPLI